MIRTTGNAEDITLGDRHVLITGGSGFIGTNVADRYLSQRHNVLLFDNMSRPGVERNYRWLKDKYGSRVRVQLADTRDRAALRQAVRHASHVFHFAAQVAVTTSLEDPMNDFLVNAGGTVNLLEELRNLNNPPPALFTSTNKVYGGLDDIALESSGSRYVPKDKILRNMGIDESRCLDFHSPYGCSKGCAEQYFLDYARCYGLKTVVFRMSCIYGPHQLGTEDQGWVAHFIIRALGDEPITLYGDGRQVRDILFVDDLVTAMQTALQQIDVTRGQVFNIGDGPSNTTSLLELIALLERLTANKPGVTFKQWRKGDQRYYASNIAKFCQ